MQSVGHLTRKSGVLGSIPGCATYFRFSFHFFKKGSCQLLAKACARSTVYNRLGGLSLPRKSVVRITDLPDMTLDVYRGRKTTIQQQQQLDHFDLYLTPVTLTFNLPKNVSNGTSPPQGQQLCQIVLKSMHCCTSYGLDKSGRTHGHTDACTYTELKL